MIEIRPLNRIETNLLIAEADDSETKNMLRFLIAKNMFPYDFLNDSNMVFRYGLVIDKRPVYLANVANNSGRFEIWSIANKNIKYQKSLYKYSKQALQEALKKFSPIYATMDKNLIKNIKWTRRMGFKLIHEDDQIVTLRVERENSCCL